MASTKSALAAEVYCIAEHQVMPPTALSPITKSPLRSNHSPLPGMVWRAKTKLAARKIPPAKIPRQKAKASISPPINRITKASGTKIITPAKVTRTP